MFYWSFISLVHFWSPAIFNSGILYALYELRGIGIVKKWYRGASVLLVEPCSAQH